jgi:hypothetical protein
LASDKNGLLGAFVTAGVGPIPRALLASALIPIEDIESRLRELPSVSRPQLLVSVKRLDDYLDLAERGVYVYDWTDINRTARAAIGAYEPVAAPINPISASELPSDLAAIADELRLTGVEFSDKIAVDVRAQVPCDEAM